MEYVINTPVSGGVLGTSGSNALLGGLQRRGLNIGILLLLLFLPFASQAQDRIVERWSLEDTDANLSFEQARMLPFERYTGVLKRGYSRSAFWVRLHLDPGELAPEQQLILSIRPSYIDDVQLYDPAYGVYGEAQVGDLYPQSNNAYPALYFNLPLLAGEGPRDIWLRLKTTSSSLMDVEVLTREEASAKDRQHELTFTLFLALLMVFLLWALMNWFMDPQDHLLGVFSLKQLLALFFSLGYLGYFKTYWPQGFTLLSPSMATNIFVVLYASFAYVFDYVFFREYRVNRWLLRLYTLVFFTAPTLLLLLMSGFVSQALAINGMVTLGIPFLSLISALSIPSSRHLAESERPLVPKFVVVLLYSGIAMVVSISVFAVNGLVGFSNPEWVFNGFLLYPLFTGATLLLTLQIRAIGIRKRRMRLEFDLHAAEQRAEHEEKKRIEQGRFLAMLTHELKTPLSVVSMVMGATNKTQSMTDKAMVSLDDVNSVLERCLQTDRLESAFIQAETSRCHPGLEVEALVAALREAHRVSLHLSPMQEIETDVVLLRRIVANLVDNALKYGAESARVDVSVESMADKGQSGILLRVCNLPGRAGWPDAEKVFEKYYRAPGAHKTTGSGLGLFLIEGLATVIHARLRYQPSDTHIIFTLWLPNSM